MRTCLTTLFTLLVTACSSDADRLSSIAPNALEAGAAGEDVLTHDGGTIPARPSCPAEERIPLIAQRYEGETYALYVPIEIDGKRGLLHFDTASPVTGVFADVPDVRSDWARGRIGCRDLPLAGLGGLGRMADVEGVPVVGMAGADLLLSEPSLLDLEAPAWVRNPSPTEKPRDGVAVAFVIRAGVVTVDASFDGVPVKALLDTGAGSTFWVTSAARPNETEVTTEDALGRPLTLYASTVSLGLGHRTGVVPLLRAPSFDIVEWWSGQTGVPLAGLVGLSSVRAIFLDAAKATLEIAPRF